LAFGDNEGYINCYVEHMIRKIQKQSKSVMTNYILKMKISPNNRSLATCSADKKIKLFKINMENDSFTLTEHKTLKGHLNGFGTVNLHVTKPISSLEALT